METLEECLKRKLNKIYPDSIWHAMSTENAIKALKNDELVPYTKHRMWSDGVKRKDSDPQYEDSYWVNGWSFTRNQQYAIDWKDVIFEFDRNEVKKNFKIMQISWNFSIDARSINHKKETEEFILSGGRRESTNFYKQEEERYAGLVDELWEKKQKGPLNKKENELFNKAEDFYWFKEWQKPDGKNLPLKRNCIGFYLLNNTSYREEHKKELEEHPLFKGYLDNKPKHTLTTLKKRRNQNRM